MKFHSEWNWWPINRPHFHAYWLEHGHCGWHVSWGNGNSDPVWSLGVEFHIPMWLDRMLP